MEFLIDCEESMFFNKTQNEKREEQKDTPCKNIYKNSCEPCNSEQKSIFSSFSSGIQEPIDFKS